MVFRRLRADEIDARVATVSEKGCSLLLYKDARVDQNILDETFGQFNWKRSHQLIGDRLYCTVEIRDPETGEWIAKQDVGTESFTEPEKGQASDSFKRACFNWGIGRELYTAPFVWVPADKCTVKAGKNGKPAVYDRFKVTEISYTDAGIIDHLVVINTGKKDIVAFSYGKAEKKTHKAEKPAAEPSISVDYNEKIGDKKVLVLKMMFAKHPEADKLESEILRLFKRSSLEEFTIGDWVKFGKAGEAFLANWDKEHAA